MEKNNIAELLKDCPKGMELDCTLFEGLEFDSIVDNEHLPICCRIKHPDGGYHVFNFTKYGYWTDSIFSKCVIFPKGKTTWEGFHRPFKDGEIISDGHCDAICIFKGEGSIKGTVDFYCGISGSDELFIKDVKDQDEHFGYINEYNFATEEEKEKLFKAIKRNGYKWNSEIKTLEKLIVPKFKAGDRIKDKNNKEWFVGQVFEKHFDISSVPNAEGYFVSIEDQDNYELVPDKFNITDLKPFDKVLVKFGDVTCWKAEHYSHYDNVGMPYSPFCCIGAWYDKCIPYEGNEHLLGTDDDCDEYYKNWE